MTKKKPKKWVACPVEEEYFKDDRKIARAERKSASARDRSKYKKSDQDQAKKQEEEVPCETLSRGRVLSISSKGILVDSNQQQYICSLRGALKQEKTEKKNLVIVGDFVLFHPLSEGEGAIAHVEERRSFLSRADNLSRKREQLIAANIDQVLITVSVVSPPLKPTLIDRYIIAARKGNMEPVIIVNKCDLLASSEEEEEFYRDFLEAYQSTAVPILSVSANTQEGLEKLRAVMKDKASVFSGQSGVGKSMLINTIAGTKFSVGEVVQKTKKGAHTTTVAQLLPLDFGGWVIDTPGIKSFGIWDVEANEVRGYFPDIQKIGEDCKYSDCQHVEETECAVIKSVEEGKLHPLRYDSYLYLIDSIKREHKSR